MTYSTNYGEFQDESQQAYFIAELNKQFQQFSTQIEYNKLNVEKLFSYKGIIL